MSSLTVYLRGVDVEELLEVLAVLRLDISRGLEGSIPAKPAESTVFFLVAEGLGAGDGKDDADGDEDDILRSLSLLRLLLLLLEVVREFLEIGSGLDGLDEGSCCCC